MSKLIVYKASAGSGKTFTLAVEYIKLLLSDPTAYRHILAVTFTHKATAEMKERILGQLYALSRNLPESAPYLNVLREGTGLSEQAIREKTGEALTRIVHDFGNFRVETIDSFFQSVMRNLARELELSPGLDIELDQDKVIKEAVENLLRDVKNGSELLTWILDYMDEQAGDGKSWNVIQRINGFGKEIFREDFARYKQEMHRCLSQPGFIRDYRNRLSKKRKEIEAQFEDYAARFSRILEQHGLTPDDFKKKKSFPLFGYFQRLAEGKELSDEKILKPTLLKLMEGEETWATASHPRRAVVEDIGARFLLPLLQEAEAYRKAHLPLYHTLQLTLTHIYNIGLLSRVSDSVQQENERLGRFLLADTNSLLHALIGDEDFSFVFEKTGTQIRHVMIDEFQDTSLLQWSNFELLLTECLAHGTDSLIVGDVKQSIYRWRGGEWKILNELRGQFGPFPIEERRLDTNRRSAAHIIGFNNFLFPRLVERLVKDYAAECSAGGEAIAKAYSDAAQLHPSGESDGSVELRMMPVDDKAEYIEATAAQLLATVRELQAAGVQQKDIAMLFRYKREIPAVADYFSLHAPDVRLISNETFRLDSSVAVGLLVEALRVLADGSDLLAATTLSVRWQEAVGRNPHALQEAASAPPGKEPADAFFAPMPEEWHDRETLAALPLQELLERLYRILRLDSIAGQDAYLLFFFDKVQEYLRKGVSNLPDFLSFWDDTLSQQTIPGASADGIRILTIHAAKGLEFHTVLLPFCDWELERALGIIWCRTPEQDPFPGPPILPAAYRKEMNDSFFHADYEREKLQQWVDNLNLLYVALTRPRERLVVWSRGKSHTVGGLMQEVLAGDLPEGLHAAGWREEKAEKPKGNPEKAAALSADGGSTFPDPMQVFSYGNPIYAPLPPAPAGKKSSPNPFLPGSGTAKVRMCSHPFRMEFRQSNRSAAFIERGGAEESGEKTYLDRGRTMHTLFASIRTADDLEPALEQLYDEGVLDRKEQAEARRIVSRALSHPQARHWYDGSARLYNECSILSRKEGSPYSQVHRPDRVMDTGGRITVVDFKFGTPRAEYRDQVLGYMRLLREMGHEAVEGYLWYVYPNRIEPVK